MNSVSRISFSAAVSFFSKAWTKTRSASATGWELSAEAVGAKSSKAAATQNTSAGTFAAGTSLFINVCSDRSVPLSGASLNSGLLSDHHHPLAVALDPQTADMHGLPGIRLVQTRPPH